MPAECLELLGKIKETKIKIKNNSFLISVDLKSSTYFAKIC
jgi:hypothetical protein